MMIKRMICFFTDHDMEFVVVPGMMAGSSIVGGIDVIEFSCKCSRCGKSYKKIKGAADARKT